VPAIKRKDIEENIELGKPLAVQRICRFIKEDGSKINYSVPELSAALNLSLISTRIAINRGLALGVFEKYENGRFKAYRLGKYGKIIADLEVDLKTYSELETVVKLIKKREQEEQ
jgi:predicted transcriptional regulator with HTH domain